MNESDVNRVRALLEGHAGVRTFSDAATYFDPAIELESELSSVQGEPYRGRSGIEAWLREIDEQFVDWRMEPREVREVGGEVIATGTMSGRGRASGFPASYGIAIVVAFGADGRIVRVRITREDPRT